MRAQPNDGFSSPADYLRAQRLSYRVNEAAMQTLATIARLHTGADTCDVCRTPWPCQTWQLAAGEHP